MGKTWLLEWLWYSWVEEGRPGGLHVRINVQELGDPSPLRLYESFVDEVRRADPDIARLLPEKPASSAAEAGRHLVGFVKDLAELDRAIVIMVDEFDHFVASELVDGGFLGQLRAVEQRPNAALIVSTARPLADACHYSVKDSPLFNVLPPERITAFTAMESKAAMTLWLGGDLDPLVQGACYRASGGWPMALAFLADRLAVAATLADARRVSSELADFLMADLGVLRAAAEARVPGSAGMFEQICRTTTKIADIAPDIADALEREAMVRREGAHFVPAWASAPDLLALLRASDRVEPLIEGLPLAWKEWVRLAAARAVVGCPELDRLLQAPDAVAALQNSRALAEVLLDRVGADLPAAALPGESSAKPWSTRRSKGAQLAHLRAAVRDHDGDAVLAWQIETLHNAGNIGAHHRKHRVDNAEVGPLLMLAVSAVARVG